MRRRKVNMNSQKGSATVTLLVVLVVVVAAILTYFAFFKKPGEVAVSPTPTATPTATKTATPNPVSSWKTYNNERFGFKYPPSISVTESPDKGYWPSGDYFVLVTLEGSNFNGSIFLNDAGRGYEQYDKLISSERITIDGLVATLNFEDAKPNYETRAGIVKFEKGNDAYFMIFEYSKAGSDQKSLIEQILSTFKFTK